MKLVFLLFFFLFVWSNLVHLQQCEITMLQMSEVLLGHCLISKGNLKLSQNLTDRKEKAMHLAEQTHTPEHWNTDLHEFCSLHHRWENDCRTYPKLYSFSQFKRASLLKAAAAATLLLFNWMSAMVSELETASIRPEWSPVAKQPYGNILKQNKD